MTKYHELLLTFDICVNLLLSIMQQKCFRPEVAPLTWFCLEWLVFLWGKYHVMFIFILLILLCKQSILTIPVCQSSVHSMVSARYRKLVILCVNASQNAQTFMTLFAAQTERTTRVNAFLSHRLAKPRLRSRWLVALKSVVGSKDILVFPGASCSKGG